MEAFGRHYNKDIEKFGITGLLHDADYEKYPDRHPEVIVERLESMGENEIAHAIAGHNTQWNVPRISLLDKAIVAADKMTGFVTAVIKTRPSRIEGLTPRPVLKKMKNKKFAASLNRNELEKGAELLGWELRDLAAFVIEALQKHKEELELIPE
jgi:predicted hydrolase (HD superfamily)